MGRIFDDDECGGTMRSLPCRGRGRPPNRRLVDRQALESTGKKIESKNEAADGNVLVLYTGLPLPLGVCYCSVLS